MSYNSSFDMNFRVVIKLWGFQHFFSFFPLSFYQCMAESVAGDVVRSSELTRSLQVFANRTL